MAGPAKAQPWGAEGEVFGLSDFEGTPLTDSAGRLAQTQKKGSPLVCCLILEGKSSPKQQERVESTGQLGRDTPLRGNGVGALPNLLGTMLRSAQQRRLRTTNEITGG